MVLATLIRLAIFKSNIMIIMNMPVSRMLSCGVEYFFEILDSDFGKSPSRLMDMGLRDAVSIPLLPVVTNASIAPTESSINPV